MVSLRSVLVGVALLLLDADAGRAQVPAWRRSLAGVAIPDSPVRGAIAGQPLEEMAATFDERVLTLSPPRPGGGRPAAARVGLRVYLPTPRRMLRPETAYEAAELGANDVFPHVHVVWSYEDDRLLSLEETVLERCVPERNVKLELRPREYGYGLNGGIYACLDDGSVVAGRFIVSGEISPQPGPLRDAALAVLEKRHAGDEIRLLAVRAQPALGVRIDASPRVSGFATVELRRNGGPLEVLRLPYELTGKERLLLGEHPVDLLAAVIGPEPPRPDDPAYVRALALGRLREELARDRPGAEIEEVLLSGGSAGGIGCGSTKDAQGRFQSASWTHHRVEARVLLRGDPAMREACYELNRLSSLGGARVSPAESGETIEPCPR